MKNKNKNILIKISYSSLFAALIFVITYFIAIPYPLGLGYFNLSDGIILFISIYFGPIIGIASGIIGTSLADLIGGYASSIPFTIIAKGLEALIGYLLYSKINNKYLKNTIYYFSTWIMVIIYFIYYLIIYDFNINSSLYSSLFDLLQGLIGYIVSLILIIIFKKFKIIRKEK